LSAPAAGDGRDADVLVVGSGFGGAVCALRLAEKGYRVVVLERGKRWRPEDFPRNNRALRRYLWLPRLGWHGIQAITPLRHVFVLHGTGVGGGSLVYANVLIEPDAEVFAGPEWGGDGWAERLRPHYREVRRMLGAVPAPSLGRTDALLREVARELHGEDTQRVHDVGVFLGTPGEEVPDPYFGGRGPRRTGCTQCAACMVGCRVGAKNTLDRNYLWLAEELGARIVPETEALAVRPDGDGWAVDTRRSIGLRRPRRTWRARQVVICAGVLGSVALLLRSRRFLPGLSPTLGRWVRTNSESLLGADAATADAAWTDGVAITSGVMLDDRTHVEMVRFNPGSDTLFALTLPLDDAPPTPGDGALRRLLRRPGRAAASLFPFGRAARSGILLAMQTGGGHLHLELRRRWWAAGSTALTSTLPPGEEAPVTHIPLAREAARRMGARMGGSAWSSFHEEVLGAPATAHILGGCRMSADGASGVVDFEGRVHGHPGLRVVDGSIVPVDLGVNPSLTIAALAEHTMACVPPRPPT
jgi:cholesterol oxidase